MAKKQPRPEGHLPELAVTLGHGAFILERTVTGWISAEVDAKEERLIRAVHQDDEGAEYPAAASLAEALRTLFHEELLIEVVTFFDEDGGVEDDED